MVSSEKRIRMVDGEWCRPNSKTAVAFKSRREWDIVHTCEVSSATGQEWVDETLYYAELEYCDVERGPGWVLHRWSRWQGGMDLWEWRDVEAAAAWLTAYSDDDALAALADLPATVEAELVRHWEATKLRELIR